MIMVTIITISLSDCRHDDWQVAELFVCGDH
jgi:hypothetical protein